MSETAQAAPSPKRINIKSGQFTAGGETYYIQTTLSVARYVEYLKRVPKLSYHTTFKGLWDALHKIYQVTSSGNDMIFAIQTARETAWNVLDAIQRFDEHEIPDIVDFVALFCVKEGEDPGKFDHSEHEGKKAAIAGEGYAIQDFFTLAFALIEGFSDAYRTVLEAARSVPSAEAKRSQVSPPTSRTSSTTPSAASTRPDSMPPKPAAR